MREVPTLLVGLGGIGSHIVDEVYHRVPASRRGRIAVHVFDTNVNDISKLRYLTPEQVTQTSTRWTVGQYLERADESVRDWFPTVIRTLHRKPLTDGAGQIRAVSRLAYRSALQAGKLENLTGQIRHIFRKDGGRAVSGVRVMIVCSLAGGTGSGIFLQTALYLRELLATTFDSHNVLIRGAFLLPDILTQSGELDAREFENVRANAYACLKELDAITGNADGDARGTGATIELEYRPGGDVVLTQNHLPFDFCFLYDFEDSRGQNLVRFDNYLELAAQTLYLQLFSPAAPENFSVEDNQIRSLIRTAGRSRYCGAGVARLIYPYEEMVEYGALRWATSSLTDEWLRLDADFDEEYRVFERDIQDGVFRQEPRLDERFVRRFDQYASTEAPDPFFRVLHRSTHVLDQRGEAGQAKAELLVAAIERAIGRTLEQDTELAHAEEECVLNDGFLKRRDRAAAEVIRVEEALAFLQREIMEAVHDHKVALKKEVVSQDCDRPSVVRGEDHHLNTWMLARPEPLHPVAVRYVLYRIHLTLERRLLELTAENERTLKAIQDYARAYDLEETRDYVETAEDRLRAAAAQPHLKRVLHNEFKEFVDEYSEKARRQRDALIRYKRSKLTELVFSEVDKAVGTMIEEWEQFFRNLRDTRNHLAQELALLAAAHEGTADPTREYVLATAAAKQQLWEEVRIHLTRGALPTDVTKPLYIGQYRRFCARQRNEPVREARIRETEQLFRDTVVSWCRGRVREQQALDMTVMQALRKEAEYRGADDVETHLSARVGGLEMLARPLVPETSHRAVIHYWAMHTGSAEQLSQDQRHALFGGHEILDDAFPRYEVIRYQAHYGLQVEDLSKFKSGDDAVGRPAGVYFAAYDVARKRLVEEPHREVTPHLDRRWHLPAYMADLEAARQREDEAKIDRAFLLGLIYGLLRPVETDRRVVWEYFGGSSRRRLMREGRAVPGHLPDLHESLFHEPIIVDRILSQAAAMQVEDFEKHRRSKTPARHRFYQGAIRLEALPDHTNILDAVLRFPEGARGERVEEAADGLRQHLLQLTANYYDAFYGPRKHRTAGEEARKLIVRLASEASAMKEADRRSGEYRQWKSSIDQFVTSLAGRA